MIVRKAPPRADLYDGAIDFSCLAIKWVVGRTDSVWFQLLLLWLVQAPVALHRDGGLFYFFPSIVRSALLMQPEIDPENTPALSEESNHLRPPFAIANPTDNDWDFETDDLLCQIIDRELTESQQYTQLDPNPPKPT